MASKAVMTSACCPRILQTLQSVCPGVTSYRAVDAILQPNAESYKLELVRDMPSDDISRKDEDDPEHHPRVIFYKIIRASSYLQTKTDWADLRRTLMYGRTEARFYRDILPDLQAKGSLFQKAVPRVYFAGYDLSEWIDDRERAVEISTDVMSFSNNDDDDDVKIDVTKLPNPEWKGGDVILECISDKLYYQKSPLSLEECKLCLKAAARLHASAWQDQELLEKTDLLLARASFHLQNRNPKELAGIVDAWNGFYKAFEKPFEETCGLIWTESLRNMGERTLKVAEYVSQQLSPKPSDPFATIVHGDYKSLNVFLPRDATTHNPLLVDFASCGIGLGMSDVGMHIHHAVTPDLLKGEAEKDLVRYYWQHICELLQTDDYSWEQAWKHYQYAVVDYFRFFLGRMWKDASPETLASKKDNKNVNLVNRDIAAACAFLVVAEEFLTAIEIELSRSDDNAI